LYPVARRAVAIVVVIVVVGRRRAILIVVVVVVARRHRSEIFTPKISDFVGSHTTQKHGTLGD